MNLSQVLDEIVRGLDMSDSNMRKLIMSELADLQLKRKAEKMSIDAASKSTKVTKRRGKKKAKE